MKMLIYRSWPLLLNQAVNIITRTLFPALQAALADQRVIVITGQRRVGKTTTATRWLLDQGYLVSRFPTPGFADFVWGGLIF